MWGAANSMAAAMVARRAPQLLCFPRGRMCLLFGRVQKPHVIKKVSCVGNGKRAEKTIWTWEGIWAGTWQAAGPSRGARHLCCQPARGLWPCPQPAWAVGGFHLVCYRLCPSLSQLLVLEPGISRAVPFGNSPLPFRKVTDMITVVIALASIYGTYVSVPDTMLSVPGALARSISACVITDIFWNTDPEINIESKA